MTFPLYLFIYLFQPSNRKKKKNKKRKKQKKTNIIMRYDEPTINPA